MSERKFKKAVFQGKEYLFEYGQSLNELDWQYISLDERFDITKWYAQNGVHILTEFDKCVDITEMQLAIDITNNFDDLFIRLNND